MTAFAELGHKVYYCQNFQQRKGIKPYEIKKNLFICPDPNLIEDNIDILWIGNPGIQNEWIGKYKEKLVVYDCVDDFYKFWGSNEDMLTRKADIIITTSKILYDRKIKQKGEDVYLISNGFNEDFLNVDNKPFLEDLSKYEGKIKIGYIGALANWFDYELLFNLAFLFNKYEFILIGQEFHTMPEGIKQEGYKNIHWLGLKPHSQLKYYINAMDVCIIPFKKNEITEATDPVKLYEYLAVGKPVVATRLTTIKNFESHVYLAEGFKEFTEKINIAMSERKEVDVNLRKNYIKQFTWKYRAQEAIKILNELNRFTIEI